MITTVGKVRDISGLDANAGIKNEQLIEFIKMAEKRVRRDVFTYVKNTRPSGNPKSGLAWDGSNTRFQTKSPICDHDFDQSTSDDVEGTWKDTDYEIQTCSVTVNNAEFGYVDIYQSNGSSPIPLSAKNIYLSYYQNDEVVPFSVLEDMGTLLVCHELQKRLTEPRQIDITDIENNKKILNLKNRDWLYAYRDLVARYTTPLLEGN